MSEFMNLLHAFMQNTSTKECPSPRYDVLSSENAGKMFIFVLFRILLFPVDTNRIWYLCLISIKMATGSLTNLKITFTSSVNKSGVFTEMKAISQG